MGMLLFDMGLPMILPSIVLMGVALVPIVLIEAYVVGSRLRLTTKKALASVTIGNLVSTFIGIPVTWFLLTVLEFVSLNVLIATTDRNPWTDLFSVTLGAPWVTPGHPDENRIIVGAMLFLLIPYGFASWVVEYLVIKMMFAKKPDAGPSLNELKLAVGKANLISYCFLAVFVILYSGVTLFSSN
jgi:hypothetical protein